MISLELTDAFLRNTPVEISKRTPGVNISPLGNILFGNSLSVTMVHLFSEHHTDKRGNSAVYSLYVGIPDEIVADLPKGAMNLELIEMRNGWQLFCNCDTTVLHICRVSDDIVEQLHGIIHSQVKRGY